MAVQWTTWHDGRVRTVGHGTDLPAAGYDLDGVWDGLYSNKRSFNLHCCIDDLVLFRLAHVRLAVRRADCNRSVEFIDQSDNTVMMIEIEA